MRDRANAEQWTARQASRLLAILLVCAAALAGAVWMKGCGDDGLRAYAAGLPAIEVHYSPAENLEAIDLAELDTATKTVDISTYAMDDKPIAEELVKLAGRGVKIRIYRDKTQYAGEVAHGEKNGTNLNLLFAGQKNIQERVKGAKVLAHLKAYVVDGKLLREGSANWSVSGEKEQDNSLLLVRDLAAATKFETNFEVIWDRVGNQVIQ